MKIYYLEEGSRKQDRNYWYDLPIAIERALEVAKFRDFPIRVFEIDAAEQKHDYVAKVFPNGVVYEYPKSIYDELKKEDDNIQNIIRSKSKRRNEELYMLLKKISDRIF